MRTLPSFRQLFATLFLLFVGLLAASVLQAWSGPPAGVTPPDGNVAAPINVGPTLQVKSGGLSVNGLSVYGRQYLEEGLEVGVHTENKITALNVNGTIKIANGGETCTGVTAGAVRFNATSAAMEYCDGTAWTAFGGGGGGSSFGAWDTKAENTAYLASTDGLVLYSGVTPSGYTRCIIYGYTDASNPPTTQRIVDGSEDNSGSSLFFSQRHGFTMPVRAGDYWKVSSTGTCSNSVYWLPVQSSSSSGGGSSVTQTLIASTPADGATCTAACSSKSASCAAAIVIDQNFGNSGATVVRDITSNCAHGGDGTNYIDRCICYK